MDGSPALRAAMRTRPLPDDFISKVRRAEYSIKHNLEIVACCRIAVQVEAPRGLQYPAEFMKPDRHHGEVRHDVAFAEETPERLQQVERFDTDGRH